MPITKSKLKSAPSEAAVLTKAALRAAEQLGMTNKSFANVIGVSEATVSRMRSGNYTLQRGQKPFELAILFVRFYRSLDAIVGGDQWVASAWLKMPRKRRKPQSRRRHFTDCSFSPSRQTRLGRPTRANTRPSPRNIERRRRSISHEVASRRRAPLGRIRRTTDGAKRSPT